MIKTSYVLELPNKNQWWDYFFGRTLSVRYREDVLEQPEEEKIDIDKIIKDAEGGTESNEVLEG